MTRRAFTPEQDQEIVREYEAGASYRQLAAKYETSDIVIRNAFLRGGGTPRRNVRRTRWTDDCRPEAVRLYREGMSVRDVARHFAVRTSVITRLLSESGEKLHPGGRAHPRFITSEDCAAVAADYAAGASLAELAERYGCTTPTIRNAIERAGGELRRPGAPTTWTVEIVEWACAAYGDGWSQQAIADHLGVHQTAVSNRLREAGVLSAPRKSGSNHHSWKGGRALTEQGYVLVTPTAEDLLFCTPNSGGYVLEHRLALAKELGRSLAPHETVHHKDGDRTHNNPDNLQLRQGRHGKGVVMQCRSCGSHDVEAVEIADA